jgi:hypothetical protein
MGHRGASARVPAQEDAGAARCAALGRLGATTRHALGEGPRAVGVFRCTRRLKPSGHVCPRAPLPRGRNRGPPRQLRLLAAAVALAPSGAVEVQHDVHIVGRWRRPTNVWRG